MPITLTPEVVDHSHGAPPLATQLADHLRQAIVSRDIAPGDELPGELKIAADTGLSRTSVRNALVQLTSEGLLEREAGAKTKVASEPPLVRRMLAQSHETEFNFVRDHGASWEQYSVNPIEVTREDATALDVLLLDVAQRSKILRRRVVECIDGHPLQLRRSAIPYNFTKNYPEVADATRYPWMGGTEAVLEHIGTAPTRYTWEAKARMPNLTERQLLQMKANGPVFDIVVVFLNEDDPVEAHRVIAPCSGNSFYLDGFTTGDDFSTAPQ